MKHKYWRCYSRLSWRGMRTFLIVAVVVVLFNGLCYGVVMNPTPVQQTYLLHIFGGVYWDVKAIGDTRIMLGLYVILYAVISGIYNIQVGGQIMSAMNYAKSKSLNAGLLYGGAVLAVMLAVSAAAYLLYQQFIMTAPVRLEEFLSFLFMAAGALVMFYGCAAFATAVLLRWGIWFGLAAVAVILGVLLYNMSALWVMIEFGRAENTAVVAMLGLGVSLTGLSLRFARRLELKR